MTDTKPRRRWYQYSLRTLLLFGVLCTIPCSWIGVKVHHARQRRTAVRELEKLGAHVGHGEPNWLEHRLDELYGDAHDFVPVEHLRLDGEACSDSAIAQIVELVDVKVLCLSADRQLTSGNCKHLARLSSLESLVLYCMSFDPEGLVHLQRLSRLRDLRVSGFTDGLRVSGITDADLAQVGKIAGLEVLQVDSAYVTGACLPHLRNLSKLKSLNLYCRVANRNLASEWPEDASRVLGEFPELKSLSLGYIKCPDAGMEHLAGTTTLTYLTLRGTVVTEAGLKHIGRMSRLTHLHLEDIELGPAGLESLAGLGELGVLSFAKTGLTDADLKHLPAFTKLQALSLTDPLISDEGLKVLRRLPALRSLTLTGTGVTDAGLVHLQQLPQLRDVHVHGTAVTDEASQPFHTADPK